MLNTQQFRAAITQHRCPPPYTVEEEKAWSVKQEFEDAISAPSYPDNPYNAEAAKAWIETRTNLFAEWSEWLAHTYAQNLPDSKQAVIFQYANDISDISVISEYEDIQDEYRRLAKFATALNEA